MAASLLAIPRLVESQVALAVPERASLVERRRAARALLLLEELQPAGVAAEQPGQVQKAA